MTDNPLPLETTLERLTLERLRLAASQVSASYVLRNSEFDVVSNVLTDQLIFRMDSHVMAERLDPSNATVSFETYASLWQHIKAVWFPRKARWLRRPVRYKTITQTVTAQNFATFPQCIRDYPSDLGRPVQVAMLSKAYWKVRDGGLYD